MLKNNTVRFANVCLLISCVVIAGFLFSPLMAGQAAGQQPGAIVRPQQPQQPLPLEQDARYAFPRAWGELHDVVASGRGGLNYILVAADGTIRVVEATDVSVNQIQVIPRR